MISRQRKWQIKQKLGGKCITCGKKAVTSEHCETHRRLHTKYHIQQSRKPKTKKAKHAYDQKRYAKEAYGEYAEHHILIMKIQDVCKEKINAQV